MMLSSFLRPLLCAALLAPGAAFAEDPEAVYRKFHAAMVAGDLEAMKPYMLTARRAEIEQTPEKDRRAIIQFMQALTPKEITIERQTIAEDGQSAALEARGIGKALIGEGEDPMIGAVRMVREDGAWRVDTSHWKSEPKEESAKQ